MEIRSGDQSIGAVETGLLGEMNVLSGGPASASVIVVKAARLFMISGSTLQRMAARGSEFCILLENGMSSDTGRKLMRTNQRLSKLKGDWA